MRKTGKAILLLIWMGVIFFMSAQPQAESQASSNLVLELFYRLYRLIAVQGMDPERFYEAFGWLVRKTAHFTEFMILGLLFAANYEEYSLKHPLLMPELCCFVYACSDEFHQLFVQGRYGSFKDVMIDSCGAFAGIIVYHLISRKWRKKQNI